MFSKFYAVQQHHHRCLRVLSHGDIAIRFRTQEQRVNVDNFNVCKNGTQNQLVNIIAKSLGLSPNEYQFSHPHICVYRI